MNAFAQDLPPLPSPTRKTLWLLSLAMPAFVGPVWCLAAGRLNTSSAPSGLGTFSGLVLLLLVTTCTVTDLRNRKIFNWATYSAIAWALLLNALAINPNSSINGTQALFGSIGLQKSLLGLAACFFIMLFPYVLARGGAGDVKLAAAIGALIGVEQSLLVIAVSYILAGASILAWSIWMQGPWKLTFAMGRLLGSMLLPMWIARPMNAERELLAKPIPLAGFFAAGTLIVVLRII